MGQTTARQSAIAAVVARPSTEARVNSSEVPVRQLFGINVFSDEVMRSRLPEAVYKGLRNTIKKGAALDPNIADVVAAAMKEWAMERGATHYTHWFQPMTGITAEKHDSFLSPTDAAPRSPSSAARSWSGASPTLRASPRAASDRPSRPRVHRLGPDQPRLHPRNPNGTTLCIPTAFCSWTGEALDKKTPLLRSMDAVSKQALRILKLFKSDASHVYATCGPEQEYFLIDKHFYYCRPDLINAGRTLFGAKPPKGQEMEDHYFGAIPERVLACMLETELELYKLGVPVKTRHNEVAPSQYEMAPLFENANVATDHNMLIMETMKRVADRYGLQLLLHEKPFAGINGSGKHVNWSLSDDLGNNLLRPGDSPHENAQFLLFLAAVLRSVARHGDLLRLSVAHAGNDHRLGANEAPPAIVSVFLGDMLQDIVEQIEKGGARSSKAGGTMQIGVSTLADPPQGRPATATGPARSPSPGTSSSSAPSAPSQSIAGPNVVLNTIVAESLDDIATELEAAVKAGKDLNGEIQALLPRYIAESKKVIFNGDGYSEAWHKEAEGRGLPNRRNTIDSIPDVISPKAVAPVRQVRRPLREGAALPLRDLPGKLQEDDQHRIRPDPPDRQPPDPPGRDPLPGRGRPVDRPAQGRRGRRPQGSGRPPQRADRDHRRSPGGDCRPRQGLRRPRRRRLDGPRQAFPGRHHPCHERRQGRRGQARRPRRRRPLAAADVSGNAVH